MGADPDLEALRSTSAAAKRIAMTRRCDLVTTFAGIGVPMISSI
jgi:hypothetical protein